MLTPRDVLEHLARLPDQAEQIAQLGMRSFWRHSAQMDGSQKHALWPWDLVLFFPACPFAAPSPPWMNRFIFARDKC